MAGRPQAVAALEVPGSTRTLKAAAECTLISKDLFKIQPLQQTELTDSPKHSFSLPWSSHKGVSV